MPTDQENLSMCWSILQQVDLRRVNWQAVADDISIGNGHTARMRWKRLNDAHKEKRGLGLDGGRQVVKKEGPAPKKERRSAAEKAEAKRKALEDDDDEEPLAARKRVKMEGDEEETLVDVKVEVKEEEELSDPDWTEDPLDIPVDPALV